MNAFEIGMDVAMEKTSGIVRDIGQGYKGLGSMIGSPRKAYGALKQSLKTQGLKGTLKGSHKELKALGTTALGVGGLGYGAHRLLKKPGEKTAAAGNPAQAVKQSLPTGTPEAQRFAPHLNQGGGMPPAHQAGPVQSQPQPWPGHVNVGNKSPGQQVPGPVARDTSPDTGEKGQADEGTMTRTKSAAFIAGVAAVLDDDGE